MNDDLKTVRLYDKAGECLLNKVEIADTFRTRLRGLLGRTHIEKDYGLLLLPCASVHMFFMKFAIDIFFLMQRGQSPSTTSLRSSVMGTVPGYEVLRVVRNLKPWRMALAPRGTDAVLETSPGAISSLPPGMSIGTVPIGSCL